MQPRNTLLATFRCLSAAVGLGLGLLASPAIALPGSQYVSLREHRHYKPKLTLSDVEAGGAAYAGQCVEFRGKVSGTIETDGDVSILLVLDDKQDLSLNLSHEDAAFVKEFSAPTLRVLAKVEPSESGTPRFSVLAVAHDGEVATIEQVAKAKLAALKRAEAWRVTSARSRRSSPRAQASYARVASRGDYTRDLAPDATCLAFARKYAAALNDHARPLFVPYFKFIRAQNPRLTGDTTAQITAALLGFADRYQVDPRLVVSLIIAESGFDPYSTSRTNAMGLGQLMPGTARSLGVRNPYDPIENLNASINYLRSRLDLFADRANPGSTVTLEQAALALAAYNAGENAVRKYNGIPPYRETQAYVRRVIGTYRRLSGR